MRNKKTMNYYIFTVAVFLFFACNKQNTSYNQSKIHTSTDVQLLESSSQQDVSDNEMFSNMMFSEELSNFFKDTRAIFDHQLMNPESKYINYQISYEKALNIGVYAVDLSYANAYEQFGHCSKYLQSMMKLSNDLGIPYTFITSINNNAKSINNSDSLYAYSKVLYNQTREYLRANDQQYASVLIVAGGWIEAMYIALKMAEQTASPQIIEKIANQKKSIESVIQLLAKENKNKTVAQFYLKLKDIQIKHNSFADNFNNQSGIEAFNELIIAIEQLRSEIVM